MSRVRAVLTSFGVLLLSAGMARRSLEPRPGVPGGVEVTPKDSGYGVLAGQTGVVVPFYVKNTKTTAATYTLACSGTGSVTCTDYEPHSVSLDPQETATVFATFSVGSTTGNLTLSASGPASDAGWYVVTVTAPPSPSIALRNFNRDNRDRGLCLTAGAGEAAAWQCGDLLVSHGMPGYATLGRDRSITLVYSSAQAAPRGVVPVAVTQGNMMMTSVTADFSIDKGAGFVPSNATGTWNPWKQSTRQIVLSANADTLPTGAYKISTSVVDNYAGIFTSATAPDTLLIVNRRKSRFGKGWSLAGVEELVFNQPVNTALGWILWVGGEGSAKLYRKLTATTWVAPAGAFRDTLVYDGTAKTYTRTLRHGIKVVFDSLGRHQQTLNRTGHATQFFWSGSPARLDSIKVPPAGRPRTTYKFAYTAAGLIDSITDPAGRALKLTVAADSTITAARDPLVSLVTSFQYDAQGRMTRRTSPRGFSTRYEYANGLRLTRVSEPYGNNTPLDTARTQFAPWDEGGISLGATTQTAVDTALAFTVIRGPRYPAVADTASFYVDRWGAPTKTVNALGHTTTYARSDAASPALITRVVFPNGRVAKLSWNGRDNLLSQTDSTDRGQATSTWEYNDLNTADSPSRTLDPLGRATRFGYDSLGLTDSVIDPRGHITRFWKRASGGKFNTFIKGTLDSVVERNVNTWWESDSTDHVTDQTVRFTYDTVGNVRTSTSPTGIMSLYARDSIERVKDIYSPDGKRTEQVYDAMNRVTESRSYTTNQANPLGLNLLQACDASQVLCVDSTKAWDGFASMLTTRYVHGPAGLDSLVDPRGVARAFTYDARGRAWRELNDYNLARRVFYNAAGLADSTISRSNITVKYEYDQLGRLLRTIYPARAGGVGGPGGSVPGDTLSYTYDVMGNMLTVHNRNGTITRSYYLDGLLKQKVTVVNGFTATFDYRYSAANELISTARGQDSVFYKYNATTGTLDSIAVWWGSPANTRRVFGFTWDSLGRRHKILYPTGTSPATSMTVTYRYDGNGQLRRVVSSHPGGSPSLGDAFTFTLANRAVDPMGRMLLQTLTCAPGTYPDGGNPCGSGTGVTTQNAYNAFAHLVRQVSGSARDSMQYDASGNMVLQRTQGSTNVRMFTVAAGHNRLTGSSCSPTGCNPKTFTYTNDGDREHDDPTPNDASDRWPYYDGLGRMAGYQTFDPQTGSQIDHHDACGYDPDGNMAKSCDNFAGWLAYDGNNVATELVSGDHGWHFVSGPGVDDQLIGYFRGTTTTRILYWVTDGQGRQLAVADSTGLLVASDGYVDRQNYRFAGTTKSGSTFGASRLETSGAAGAGLAFFRNRAYDQNTGRWTQEDPIGLAGGVNLYQFNGNNPVTFTDPFGLLECKETGNCVQGDGGRRESLIWQSAHIKITASNGTDYEGVDPALKTAVVRAAIRMGDATLGISAGKESGHSVSGRHGDGGAVDINQVNGVRFTDMPAETAAETGNALGAHIANSLP